MLSIKSKKKIVRDEDGKERESRYLIVNGISDKESYFSDGKRPYSYSSFKNQDVINILTNHSFNEVGIFFEKILFKLDVDWWENWIEINVCCKPNFFQDKTPCIKIDLQILNWEHWIKPWSISNVGKQFEMNIHGLMNEKIKYWQEEPDSVINGFGIEYFPDDESVTIKKEISKILSILEPIIDKTNKGLRASLDNESVLTYFQFPEGIKIACKQYLLYFVQFMADMGVLIDSELKEEVNHTLFKITPKNKNDSLDRIREALNIYLNAPNDKLFQKEITHQTDIAAKQWEANFYHLQSQLTLAQSTIELKDSTIEMLKITNYQYKQLLESPNVNKDSEEEEIIKGIVAVKKYDGQGFSINFAEIFRRLKRRIKK